MLAGTIFIDDNFANTLNSQKKNIINLKSVYFGIIFLLVGLIFLTSSQDAFAITYQITIPKGAADPKEPSHFLPSEITVTIDDKIQWYNIDSTTHTATSGSFQGGPDGIFNSGLLEPKDFYIYQPTQADIGKLSYYCTLHPWMNGIITILDPEGMPVARIAEAGSLEAAQGYLQEAQSFLENAKDYADTGLDNQAATTYIQAGINFHKAALEYGLENDHENAAKYHNEAAMQYHNAALHFEKSEDFTQSVIQHHHAGVHHHFAGVSHQMMEDYKTASKHFAEALLHKGMAKFGSKYILPPTHQLRWLADPSDLTCREGLEIVLKSTTKEPVCVKPSSIETLIERNWAVKS